MNAVENFESIASALYDEAPSENARKFAAALSERIRAKGGEWIEQNSASLHLEMSAEKLEATAPVEDNRLYYLGQWQLALSK